MLPVAWAGWTGRHLGAVYEALLDPAARRQGGIYYTPAPIVESILGGDAGPVAGRSGARPRPLRRRAGRARAAIPACGAGYFLVGTADALAAAWPPPIRRGPGRHAGRRAAAGCVYGADSDPVAADLARYSLALFGGAAGAGPRPYTPLRRCTAAALPAGWTGFDAVVGNPPYLGCRARRAQSALPRAYRAARGQYDLSGLFIERGPGAAAAGRVLGYIVPEQVHGRRIWRAVRGLLARETSILRLEDVSRTASFPARPPTR